jgi:RNA polymerase sigma factor (sigma-70 family)
MAASVGYVLAQLQRWTSPRLDELSDALLLERFRHERDESAFAALVARHGDMVLRCCRRILGDVHEAEDAFQATFLILARKAHLLRQPRALPGFLHSIARRVALKARTKAASCPDNSHRIERLPDPHPDPLTQLTARELLAVLDEEVTRLPAAQRSAVLLCCLDGHTREEAARILGCSPGSLKGHLERGRRRLQTRLQRRGIALPAALAVATVSRNEAASMLIIQSTVKAALGSSISSPATALAHSVLQAMLWPKLVAVMAVTLTLVLAASATVILIQRGAMTEDPQDKTPVASAAPKDAEASKPQVRTDALGDPLPQGAIARLGTVRFRHGGRIHRMIFSADGKQLLSTGTDGLRVWDIATGKGLKSLTPPGENWGWGTSDFFPDGDRLAVVHGFQSSTIDIWSRRLGKKIDSFGKGNYTRIRISPDGKLAAVAIYDTADIELWDVARRKKLRSWKAHVCQIGSLDFSADSQRLLSSGSENVFRLWDVGTGRKLQELANPHNSAQNLTSVPLSPDGSLLAVTEFEYEEPKKAGAEGTRKTCVSVWDTATGKQLQRLTAEVSKNNWTFLAAMFTPDSKRLFTSGPDHYFRIWDPRTGKELRKIPSDPRTGHVLALSKDGKTLAAGSGMAIHLLDLPSGRAYEPPEGQAMASSNPYFSALSPDGRTAITSSLEYAPLVWDVERGPIRQGLGKHSNLLASFQFSRDGKTLFAGDYDNVLRLWDLSQGEERSHVQLNFERSFDKGILVSPDDRSVFLADGKGIIHRLDAATGKERSCFQGPKYLWGLACTPDGESLVGWSGDRKIRVWDAADGHLRHEYPVPKEIKGGPVYEGPNGGGTASRYSAALSPDGRLLAMGSLLDEEAVPTRKQHYALIFKDLSTGRDIAHCDPLPSTPSLLRFSPDGRMLAYSGDGSDPTIPLLEAASGRERRCLAGQLGYVTSLSFSADGRRLLSSCYEEALVWDLGISRTSKTPTAAEAEKLWADLAGEDAARAYAAIHKLAASPNVAVPFLRKHLPPVPAADEKRVARLIADLDSDDFATRQRASGDLEKLGERALPAYRRALEGKPSLETRRRLEDLQRRAYAAWWDVSGERLRSLRAIEALEMAGTEEARDVLKTLAAGAEGTRLTQEATAALKRLIRRAGRVNAPVRTPGA